MSIEFALPLKIKTRKKDVRLLHLRYRSLYRYMSADTKQYNPNFLPIGDGFGFIVFMEEIEDW